MSRRDDQAGTFELLAKLPYQLVRLAKAEFENAKREITVKLKRGGIGLLAIIVALFFVFFAIGCLVTAAVAGIAVVWPVWLSAMPYFRLSQCLKSCINGAPFAAFVANIRRFTGHGRTSSTRRRAMCTTPERAYVPHEHYFLPFGGTTPTGRCSLHF